jgi:hypothetical protein
MWFVVLKGVLAAPFFVVGATLAVALCWLLLQLLIRARASLALTGITITTVLQPQK